MKVKTRLLKIVLYVFFFLACVFSVTGIKIAHAKKASATDTVTYHKISCLDFHVSSAKLSSNGKYNVYLSYDGTDENVKSILTGYADFDEKHIPLTTDDDEIVEWAGSEMAGANKLAIYVANKPTLDGALTFLQAAPTKLVFKKGQTFTKSNVGFMFTDAMVLVKTGEDLWEITTLKTVPVQITINSETTEEEIEQDGVYTLPTASAVKGKTFVGWEICDNLYATGESVQISDCIDEEMQSVTVNAVYLDYALMTGASIRCDKDMTSSGIRFTAVLMGADELPAYITGLGVIVIPQDLIGKAEFTLDNYDGVGQAKNFSAQRADIFADEKGRFEFRASIVSVLEENYNRTFAARAYLIMQTEDGETKYIWCDNIETRSVYQVATKASADETLSAQHRKIVQTYLNRVANISFDGNTTKVISAASAPTITSARATKIGATVTLDLTTTESNFVALTYNGERIKDFSVQAQENGLIITFTMDEV